ncbi:MAG TPA: hypothetical protein VFE13_05050, partial [Caulobacteraceae bacterium]|nr:hypothetical protein [Caulobacteraceae bacterium]
MKFAFLTAGAAVALLAAMPAFADPSTSVTVSGHVASQCGVGNQSGGGVRGDHGGLSTVSFASLTDSNGQLSVPDQTIAFDNVWCNNANSLTMTVTSLKTTTAVSDASSFVNNLDMVVSNTPGTALILQTYFGGATSVQTGVGGADGVLTHANAGAFE